jgi:hypothetical protein
MCQRQQTIHFLLVCGFAANQQKKLSFQPAGGEKALAVATASIPLHSGLWQPYCCHSLRFPYCTSGLAVVQWKEAHKDVSAE